MPVINVDFEVFKELTARRQTEEMTENDVLREIFKLKKQVADKAPKSIGVPWVVKGVSFPAGTEFRASYKGRQFTGVVKDGALIVDGKKFSSPSAAAVAITGSAVNGWRFWECRFPESAAWKSADDFRAASQ